MKRYFAKIDENSTCIRWELNKKTNEIFVEWSPHQSYSPLCINTTGNLFVALDKIRNNNYKVLFLSESPDGMKEYFNFNEFTSGDAFYWATYIGNREAVIDKITESQYAYYWAYYIGNKEVMIDKITDSHYAFRWVLDIGNKDVMIDKITEQKYAFCWARDIGDRGIMKERITHEYWMKEFEQLP